MGMQGRRALCHRSSCCLLFSFKLLGKMRRALNINSTGYRPLLGYFSSQNLYTNYFQPSPYLTSTISIMISRFMLAAVSLVELVAVVNALPYISRHGFQNLLLAAPCERTSAQTNAPGVIQLPLKHEPSMHIQTTHLEVNWSFFCHDGDCLGEVAFSVNDGTNTRKFFTTCPSFHTCLLRRYSLLR
jgi:hypothetical protein